MNLKYDFPIPFDCDDTLIMWNITDNCPTITIEYLGQLNKVRPNKVHVELLKHYKMQGHSIIVWSAGGSEWAKKVVSALNLDEFVDLTMGKPTFYVDDVDVWQWMGRRVYFKEQL